MEKKLKWESKHYEFDPIHRKLERIFDDENIEQHDDEDDLEDEISEEEFQKLMIPGMMEGKTITATPFGLYDIDDTLHPFRQYKLWMVHTNFSIGEKTALLIEFTPGVEVLAILTRYRFLIGIGECFDIRDVRQEIERRLCGDSKKFKDIILTDGNKLSTVVSELQKNNKKWAIYVFPNFSYELVVQDDKSNIVDFEKQKALLKLSIGESNGIYLDNNSSELQGLA